MNRDYLQEALHTFNGGDWFGWKTHDDNGNKIPNKDRMQYQYIKIIKEGATMPSEADVNAKIQEIKDADTARAIIERTRSDLTNAIVSESLRKELKNK